MLLHATSLLIKNNGILLVGASGVGKSDLALRLIDVGAVLIADDQTMLRVEQGLLIASAPPAIAGLFEIRHVGLVKMPTVKQAAITLSIELGDLDEKRERLPEPDVIFLLDHPVRRLRLPSFAASTPAKIRAALLYPMASDL